MVAKKKINSKAAAPKGKAQPAASPKKPVKKAASAPAAAAKKPAATKQKQPAAKPVKGQKLVKAPVAKKAPAATKATADKKPAPKTAPKKPVAAVAKKPVVTKKAPAKAVSPAKLPPAPKAAAAKSDAKKAPAESPKAAAKAPLPAASVKQPAPAKAAKPTNHAPANDGKAPALPVRKSSLVDFPVPPPPVKPPFVPPKPTATVSLEDTPATGGGGSHSPAFVQKQRQRLLDLRDELVDAMSGMTRDTIRNAPEGSEASGSGQHQGDAGSDAYDRDFALSVLAKEQDALYEIEQALRRIQSGTYGICEISARKIPHARLEAIPFARLTVECQAQWEKEYGKRRFRPSNEVGFSGGNYIEDEDSETVSLDEEED